MRLIAMTTILLVATTAGSLAAEETGVGVRLKDLCRIEGVRDNQLHGVGIVVGLSGTGDGSPAALHMLRQMLARKQLNFTNADLNANNVAMVAVTADLPSFAANGSRLQTQVSCIGDANSLRGGMLLQTPLVAADGRIYAVAQGPVSVGGFGEAGPQLTSVGASHNNVLTVAQLVQGALVEREVPVTLLFGDELRLRLRDPDFTTAHKVAGVLAQEFGERWVSAQDASMIRISFPERPSEATLVAVISRLEALRVEPDVAARVVINERTGTIVVGREVQIAEVAVSHGGLSLHVHPRQRVRADPRNPNQVISERVWEVPGGGEPTTELPPGVKPLAVRGSLSLVGGVSVEDIANGLNALGVRPRDLVAIFQALHRAGALHAELVVM